ncbi:MAG: DNA (cytosine-5-)-methyltransferase [Acidobacteria bacterium]|nr:DNA (cytosine-5-)-methyltransferase [Acidobacteriota bacterium]
MPTVPTGGELKNLTFVGLFAGIGGFELGFKTAGFRPILMCEIDENARRVLDTRFPEVKLHSDIRDLPKLPKVDVLCAGFPCQDLSAAGKTAGIEGSHSGLIWEVFRLLKRGPKPSWVVFENVPFMLQLNGGKAIKVITEELAELGFSWAYRVVDARSFGIPQRRRRVILIASRSGNARRVLLGDEAPLGDQQDNGACGFFWTEGNTGLGWARNAIPTLKSGSGLGIPSPPGIWLKGKGIFTPSIMDAERLQGFPANWTACVDPSKARFRWRLVGNALTVPIAEWLARRILQPGPYDHRTDTRIDVHTGGWPYAAWGNAANVFRSNASEWPVSRKWTPLSEFLEHEMSPLSFNATAGFLKRARASRLKFEPGFLEDVAKHVEAMGQNSHATKRTNPSKAFVPASQ